MVDNKCDQLGKEFLATTLLRDSEVPRILNRVAPINYARA